MAYQGIGSALLGMLPEGIKLIRVTANDPHVIQRNWMLSFVSGIDRWASFHSYSPWALASSRKRLLGTKGASVYAHNLDVSGFFYGTIHSAYVDAHIAPKTDKTYLLQSLSWESRVTNNVGEVLMATFSKATVYDSNQLSSTVALTNLSTVRRVENTWRFNVFRDLAIPNVPLKIGRSFNPAALDTNRNWQVQKRFIDRWFSVRLETDNSTGNTVYLHDVTPLYRESYR